MVVIKPQKSLGIDFNELWTYRELFYALAWRDVKVRYKQTILGILWAILQPFFMMVVFSVFFGRIAGISSEGVPYPIFAYSGLLFWNYFSNSLSSVSDSLVGAQSMIQKVYFPRLILPLSATLVHLVDFFFASIIFIGMMMYYHFSPTLVGILLVIPALFIAFLAFSGLGLIFASINVKYRDVRYALPFVMKILIFVTPVIYPASIMGKYQWIWYLNPMSGVIETMRKGLLGAGSIDWQLLGVSFLLSVVLFVIGFIYFNRTEKYFADLI